MLLKLFFVITTSMTLVTFNDAAKWICEDINQTGNCSTLPKVSRLLKMMENYSDTNEYSDIYYCPYNIVKRNDKCIHTYYLSCHDQMTNEEKTFFLNNLPTFEEPYLCTIDRAYKREFKKHIACAKELAKSKDKLEVPYRQWQQFVEQQKLEYERKKQEELENDQIKDIVDLHFWREKDPKKCHFFRYFKEFMRLRYMQMRSHCGVKTEKFFRELLGNMWPMSEMAKNCESD